MRHYIFISSLFLLFSIIHAQPKHEIRAAWLTTAYSLDWPRNKATSPANIQKQKDELIEILDKLYNANFNTILFQTRIRGEVIYPSTIEPISSLLTGISGKKPGYDPLAFAIEECHKRGMECHAWMVAIPLGPASLAKSLGKNSITQKHPDICIHYKNFWYLNPGNPSTKNYLMSLVQEIINKYDLDGVHFDYLRYPENEKKFPDTKEFQKYGKGKSLEQWRRDNLTDILRHIYINVKKQKPWIKVSTSPVGKYRNTSRYRSNGWNAYHSVYQDVQGWLAEGIEDQIYPMMYFRENNFYPFALDWQENNNGRHIIPGLGIYFLHPNEGNWKREDIERQINFIRSNGLAGEAYYRVKYLMDNTQGLYDELNEKYYLYPALQLPMKWLDDIPPTSPKQLQAKTENGYTTLTWEMSMDNDPQNKPYYVVYGSDTYPVDTNKPENIIAQRIQTNHYMYAPIYPWETKNYFAVTAMDRYGNESESMQLNRP